MQLILIVDDIPNNLYFLEVLLKGNGFEVLSALNGSEALDIARTTPPDLIVSDILMPVMDGYALCREWRADERLKQIPFIFYTATFTEQKDEELALSLGADRFIIKPQEPEVLMNIFREVLTSSGCSNRYVSVDTCRNEGELLREYNEALFRKLEKKMADLELVNHELNQKIAEQKRLEEQLRQAQKMEAIGRFSTGVAHDFNNILTVITCFSEMIRSKMSKGDPQLDNINQIIAAADRATNLTRSLLTFSRKQEMKLQPLNLNDCIRNVDIFLHRVIGDDVKLVLSLSQGLIPIVADQGHIEQVLMNLAANARDAMPDGGMLSIGSDIIEIDEAFVQMHGYGIPGRYASLIVSDNGIGMDELTRQKIFEPFFTTKGPGLGTGLGLSIIYGIVSQHKGYISAYSEPGQGTTFRILLPLMSGEISSNRVRACNEPLHGGHETILIADDESSIRHCLGLLLTSLGYSVLLAQNGHEAINIFREKSQDVDLVLMDLIMPDLGGSEAAKEIRHIRSDVKIIFTSGYPHGIILERKLIDEGMPLLSKPLTPTVLAKTLRAALDREV